MKKYFKQLKANKKGFTLIEMIVVIAIIGILAAVLVPSMAGYLSTAKESRKEANAKAVYTAAQAAVTSLEATDNALKDEKYDVDNKTDLGKKIINFIGKSNYEKFNKITVEVEDGTVKSVTVTENDDKKTTTKYPKS